MILEVKDVHTFYGSSHILHGISLSVNEGEVVCLLGRNGAGKTTTLRSIMGLTPSRSGSIRFREVEIRGKAPYSIARLGIGFVPDTRKIIPTLTVKDNLILGERQSRIKKWTLERVYGLFDDLKPLENRLGGHLSGGQQQMLTIGRTLMGNPTLLLLDEPAEGLAPVIVKRLLDQLKTLVGEKEIILLAEQNVKFATELSSRAYVLEKGQIRFRGTIQEIKTNEEIKKKYLMA